MKNKKNIAILVVLVIVVIVFAVSSYSTFQKNTILSNQGSAILSLQSPTSPAQPVSAVIIDVFTKHADNMSYSCKDTSKCSSNSTNSSNDASREYRISAPYTDGKQPIMKATANSIFTAAFADRYGITGTADSGTLDLNTNSGTETLTQTGPKGRSVTFNIPPSAWVAIGGPQVPSDNVKGSDSSANWNDSSNGQTSTGVWFAYSYSGYSSKNLIVRGDPSRKYNVVISAGANEWHLAKASDYGPDFNPRYFVTGSEVFCPNIRIMGTKLNYDCKRSFTLVPGTYNVTPSAGISRYLYSISVISITDAGPAPTPTPTTNYNSAS